MARTERKPDGTIFTFPDDTPPPAKPWDIFQDHVDKSISDARYEICSSCPELIKLTKQCKLCGCFMIAKTKIPHAACPLGKWPATTQSG